MPVVQASGAVCVMVVYCSCMVLAFLMYPSVLWVQVCICYLTD